MLLGAEIASSCAFRSLRPCCANLSTKARGAFQWWKKPVYYRPVVSPLQRGPDFAYLDGRKPAITSQEELERRRHQVELGRRAIQYLSEIKEAQELFEQESIKEDMERKRLEDRIPKVKGNQEIF